MRWTLSILTALLGMPHANADTQELRYTLSFKGSEVGHRDLSIRYIASEQGEKRFIESWTEFNVRIAQRDFGYKQRLTGLAKSRPMGFAAAMSEDGHLREVQVAEQPERWIVTHAEYGRSWAIPVDSGSFDATSLTLVDPGAKGFLDNVLDLKVLSAETGTVVSGQLQRKGEKNLSIDGSDVLVDTYKWSAEGGAVELAYNSEGYLVHYTVQVAGQELSATLNALPPARSFEEDLPASFNAGAIVEEAL